MRWPWQPRPGMVRVSSRRLIELQRDALRAAELQGEIRERHRECRLAEAQDRAYQLLDERSQLAGVGVEPAVRAAVLADLPLTGEGELHEGAFAALVDALVWKSFEQELTGLLPTSE